MARQVLKLMSRLCLFAPFLYQSFYKSGIPCKSSIILESKNVIYWTKMFWNSVEIHKQFYSQVIFSQTESKKNFQSVVPDFTPAKQITKHVLSDTWGFNGLFPYTVLALAIAGRRWS